MVEFGAGVEPWSVARGGVKRWMHCLIRDVGALTEAHRAELAAWLAEHDVAAEVKTLLVTRSADGEDRRVHVPGGAVDLPLGDLPMWLQHPEPEPKPAPKKTAVKPPARPKSAPESE